MKKERINAFDKHFVDMSLSVSYLMKNHPKLKCLPPNAEVQFCVGETDWDKLEVEEVSENVDTGEKLYECYPSGKAAYDAIKDKL